MKTFFITATLILTIGKSFSQSNFKVRVTTNIDLKSSSFELSKDFQTYILNKEEFIYEAVSFYPMLSKVHIDDRSDSCYIGSYDEAKDAFIKMLKYYKRNSVDVMYSTLRIENYKFIEGKNDGVMGAEIVLYDSNGGAGSQESSYDTANLIFIPCK